MIIRLSEWLPCPHAWKIVTVTMAKAPLQDLNKKCWICPNTLSIIFRQYFSKHLFIKLIFLKFGWQKYLGLLQRIGCLEVMNPPAQMWESSQVLIMSNAHAQTITVSIRGMWITREQCHSQSIFFAIKMSSINMLI